MFICAPLWCPDFIVLLCVQEATMSMVSDRPDLREKEHDAFVALPQELQTDIMRFHHASVLKKR